MSIIIEKDEFESRKEELKREIKQGAVFVHPTDTIYGIGCSAVDSKAVKRVRDAKDRYSRPFSVIAPSVEWIRENCEVSKDGEKWIKMLPGPFTFIMKLKGKNVVAKEVNNGMNTIGVRIPKHWFTYFVSELGVPVVTTSANVSGGEFMTELDDLDPKVKMKMDFIIYDGVKQGRPSKIVDLSSDVFEVKER